VVTLPSYSCSKAPERPQHSALQSLNVRWIQWEGESITSFGSVLTSYSMSASQTSLSISTICRYSLHVTEREMRLSVNGTLTANTIFLSHTCLEPGDTTHQVVTESRRTSRSGGGGLGRCRDGHLSSAGVDQENDFAVGVVRASHVCVYARTGAGA
jgi:hypothetical protein